MVEPDYINLTKGVLNARAAFHDALVAAATVGLTVTTHLVYGPPVAGAGQSSVTGVGPIGIFRAYPEGGSPMAAAADCDGLSAAVYAAGKGFQSALDAAISAGLAVLGAATYGTAIMGQMPVTGMAAFNVIKVFAPVE